jgi:hypothetical protein
MTGLEASKFLFQPGSIVNPGDLVHFTADTIELVDTTVVVSIELVMFLHLEIH